MPPSAIKQQEAVLLVATVVAAVAWWIHQRRRPKLQPKTPVPSDIEISQSIVREVGLLTMEQVGKE